MSEEIWLPCPDFEKKYLISNKGRILSIGTYNTCKKGIIKQHKKKGRNGYMQVQLFDSGHYKTIEVHTLVAKAFIPNHDKLPIVNHKDENKTNNCVENLEWCTVKYNCRYSNSKEIDIYTKDGLFIETISCISDAAIKYKTFTSSISRCCRSKYGTCKGFQFRYHGEPFSKRPISKYQLRKMRKGHNPHETRRKKINEFTLDNKFVKTWDSITEASLCYNIPTTNICKCCKGLIKTINKKIFKYAKK